MTRVDHVWVAQKDGEERRYTSAVPFSEPFRRVLNGEGYSVIRVSYVVADPSVAVAASATEPA
jgi:hypothetical protein